MRTPTRLAAAGTLLFGLVACGQGGSAQPSAPPPAGGHSTTAAHGHTAPGAADDAALPLRAGERFLQLTAAKPYTPAPPNGGTDEYRCMIVDPELAKGQYLTGVQFKPQNTAISHHTITFVVPPQDAAAIRARDSKTPGEGWTCFGTDGLDTSTWADTWTPGVRETLLAPGLGYRMEPGSLLVLQVHYNLLTTGGRPAGSDQSSVRLRMTDGTDRTVALATFPLTAPIELPCPPGEAGPLCDRDAAVADVHQRFGAESVEMHKGLREACGAPTPGNTQVCDYRIPAPMTVYASRGHMHLLGRSISIERNPGTPRAEKLLDVKMFNFDDQALHVRDEPLVLEAGDTLRVSCTHDASLRRQLPQLESLPPRYVVWGEGTADEMCLGMLTVATP